MDHVAGWVYKKPRGAFQSFLACARCYSYGIVFLPLLFVLFFFAVTMTHEGPSTAPTSEQFAQLLEAIQANQTRMDEKLEEFRAELQQGQEEAASKALKRVRREKAYVFKRKGNKEQAAFNERVEEVIADAQAKLVTVGRRTGRGAG